MVGKSNAIDMPRLEDVNCVIIQQNEFWKTKITLLYWIPKSPLITI